MEKRNWGELHAEEATRMSIIAGGRVKLQTSQAKNNEVACAKLQQQAVRELLP